MLRKEGTLVPEKGTLVHQSAHRGTKSEVYASMVSAALRGKSRDARHATKTVMKWTGASERTVKHWASGTRGPSGAHLIALVRNSDAVLSAFLELAGRRNSRADGLLAEVQDRLAELQMLIELSDDGQLRGVLPLRR
jgi:hypothetical protein